MTSLQSSQGRSGDNSELGVSTLGSPDLQSSYRKPSTYSVRPGGSKLCASAEKLASSVTRSELSFSRSLGSRPSRSGSKLRHSANVPGPAEAPDARLGFVSVRRNLQRLKLLQHSSASTERPTRLDCCVPEDKPPSLAGRLLLSPRLPTLNLFRDPQLSGNLRPRARPLWKKKPDPARAAGGSRLSIQI